MNYASMMLAFTVIAGAASGGMMAAMEKARMAAVILSTLGGLAFGLALGGYSYNFASVALKSKKLTAGVQLLIYMVIPLLSLLVGIIGTAWLVKLVL